MRRTVNEAVYETNPVIMTNPGEFEKSAHVETNNEDEIWDGYHVMNGYKVREVFDGEEELTDLLAQYVERITAVRY